MLKLMKYEFMKMRVTLLALVAGLIALEAGFLIGEATNRTAMMSVCLTLVLILTFGVFAYLIIAGIVSYSQELRDKSGYLIFMTPVRPLGIVLSKLLFIALVSLVAMALFGGASYLDIRHLIVRLDLDAKDLATINSMLRFGLRTNATLAQILQMVLLFAVMTLDQVLMTMCTAYLAITLSATLLQNKKGFVRGLISVVLFALLTWGAGWVTSKLTYGGVTIDESADWTVAIEQLRRGMGLGALVDLGFSAIFVAVSAWLLDRKVDL